jgi:hypothetical protein
MLVIYKYPLAIRDFQTVELPTGAKLLHVAQQGRLQLWALVDPEVKATYAQEIFIFGTGHPMTKNPGIHLGTVITGEGALVWHVFAGAPPVELKSGKGK